MATTQWKKNNITYDIHDSRLPSSYGTAGQVLATNLSGTGIEWINQSTAPTYTAGDNIQINNNVISATDTTYTAGTNITIDDNNVISSSGTSYTAGQDITLNNNVIQTVYGGSYTPPVETIVWDFNGSWTRPAESSIVLKNGAYVDSERFIVGTTYTYEIICNGTTISGTKTITVADNMYIIHNSLMYILGYVYNAAHTLGLAIISTPNAGDVVTKVKVYIPNTPASYTPINANYVPVDGDTIYIQDGVIKSTGGSGGEPAAYLKSASSSGNTLTLVNKDNSTTTYTPTVPTKTSDLTNDSGFIDNTYHDASKQDLLIAGTNVQLNNNIISATDTTYSSGQDVIVGLNNHINTIYEGNKQTSTNETIYISNQTGVITFQGAGRCNVGTWINLVDSADLPYQSLVIEGTYNGSPFTYTYSGTGGRINTPSGRKVFQFLSGESIYGINSIMAWDVDSSYPRYVDIYCSDAEGSYTFTKVEWKKVEQITTYTPISTNYMPIDNNTIYVEDGVMKAQGGSGSSVEAGRDTNIFNNQLGTIYGGYKYYATAPIIDFNGCLIKDLASSTAWTLTLPSAPTIAVGTTYKFLIDGFKLNGSQSSTTASGVFSLSDNVYTWSGNGWTITVSGNTMTVRQNSQQLTHLVRLLIVVSNNSLKYKPIDLDYLGMYDTTNNQTFISWNSTTSSDVYYKSAGPIKLLPNLKYGYQLGNYPVDSNNNPVPGTYNLLLVITGSGTSADPYRFTYNWVAQS